MGHKNGCGYGEVALQGREGGSSKVGAQAGFFSSAWFHRLSLRRKTELVGLAQMLLLMVLLGASLHYLVQRAFDQDERLDLAGAVSRVDQSLQQTAITMERSIHDYAVWDDAYNFVAHPDPRFMDTNLNLDVLSNLRLSDALVLDRNLRLVAGTSLAPGAESVQNVSPAVVAAAYPFAEGLLKGEKISAAGLTLVGNDLHFIAACRILPTPPNRPFNGIFIHVRRVDAELLGDCARMTGQPLQLSYNPATLGRFSIPGPAYVDLEQTPDFLHVAIPIRDAQGRIIAALETPYPREAQELAQRFIVLVYGALLVVLVASALLLPLAIRAFVLGRLERLHAFVARVGESKSLSERLPVRDGDELDALAQGFNRALDALRASQALQLEAEKEQLRVQEQLYQNQKFEAVATMAGGIAHDFNNNLSCIMGSLELLEDELDAKHTGRKHIDRMRKAGSNSCTLVRQMLNLTRTGHVHMASVRLGDTVSEVLKLVRAGLPKAIEIQFENLTADDQIMVDATHLQQVIMNFATNAAHAMAGKPSGLIRVVIDSTTLPDASNHPETAALPPGSYLRIAFSDNGEGIPPDIISKVFDPFFTTKPVGSGTGLGLAAAQAFVSQHGGVLGVKSRPGEGATFTIHLPKGSTPVHEPRLEAIQGLKVLLVDDDPHGRETLAEGLRRASHSVTETPGASSALRLFEENPDSFDVVVTDQIMPGMTGMDLAEQIACLAPGVPVVLMSGYAGQIDPKLLKERGIVKLLAKPVALVDLDRTIRESRLPRNP